MEFKTSRPSRALHGALASFVLALVACSADAAAITSFHIYAANMVTVGGSTIVGTPNLPSLVGAGTMVVGVGDAKINGGAGIYGDLRAGDDVNMQNNTFVTGTITNPDAFTVGSGVTFGAHITATPDLPTLPAATVFSNGVVDQSFSSNGVTLNLAPGSWREVKVGGASTLNLTAGDYYIRNLQSGGGLTINVNTLGGSGNVRLFITEDFNVAGTMAMNFTNGGDWHNVFVETHSTDDNAFKIAGTSGTQWRGSVFTPNGGIHLGSGSSGTGVVVGYLWAGTNVDLEHGLDVYVPEPTTYALLGLGMAGMFLFRARRRRS